jgi:pyruvate dehydrogenase E2 component (dihydrolipoamide acetyltransferase)
MQKTTFRLPRLGGAEAEARLIGWKKAAGDAFSAGETLAEVETDKAIVDLPAPMDGVMVRPLKEVDDQVAFDEPMAEIEVGDDVDLGDTEDAADEDVPAAAQRAAPEGRAAASGLAPSSQRVFATPVARKLARDAGIDLAGVQGSGVGGRIVRRDIERRSSAAASASAADTRTDMFRGRLGDVHVKRWNVPAGPGVATHVLIHGLFGDVDTWAGLVSGLVDAGRPVLALDLPCHGKTSAQAATLDEMAEIAHAVLAAWAPGPKVLVGHSLGGALAVKLAAGPAEGTIDGVALIAPAGLGTEIDQGFVDGMLHAGSPALLRREIDKLTQRPPSFSEPRVAEMHAGFRARAAGLEALVSRFAVRGVQQVDVRAQLGALRAPVSVLWGRRDRIIPWDHALNAPPHAALHLFPDAGHMPQWENTSLVLQAILRLSAAKTR